MPMTTSPSPATAPTRRGDGVSDPGATRVLVADDHAVLRDGLRGALEDAGLVVVGEAVDGAETVELAERTRPDVIVMDLSMPVLDGVEATRRVRRKLPDVRVLVLTMHADPDLVGQARAAGAVGYLLKDRSLPEVVDAVRRVAGGGAVISPGLVPGHVEPAPETSEVSAAGLLSEREEEVLQALADGYSPLQAAKRLFISPKTVKNHLSSIYEKLGVADRTQAVLAALRLGIVSLTPASSGDVTAGSGSPVAGTSAPARLAAVE